LICCDIESSDVLMMTSATRVLGTVRVRDRHPVSAGASPINPTTHACRIFIGTNLKYIYPLAQFCRAKHKDVSFMFFGCLSTGRGCAEFL
jgi:hypothetical protein